MTEDATGALPPGGSRGMSPCVPGFEVSASIGALVVAVATARGASRAALLDGTGFDPALAASPDARIPLEVELTLWRRAAEATGDDAFGLHAAAVLRPGTFDVLDYAVRTAPTLHAALTRLARYNRLVHDVAVWSVEERGDAVVLQHGFSVPGLAQERQAAEFTMASIVTIGSDMNGDRVRPRTVAFHHARPTKVTTLEAHREVFGVEPAFGRPHNGMEFDLALCRRPLPAADPSLSNVLERHAEALLAARPAPPSTTGERVRQILAAALGEGEVSLADVARRLKSSERSVQRRLADEGVTFDAILDEVRRDLALSYLADPKIAVAEVAYLLGYSEPSPFHRAFKRWTGKTPTEARRRVA